MIQQVVSRVFAAKKAFVYIAGMMELLAVGDVERACAMCKATSFGPHLRVVCYLTYEDPTVDRQEHDLSEAHRRGRFQPASDEIFCGPCATATLCELLGLLGSTHDEHDEYGQQAVLNHAAGTIAAGYTLAIGTVREVGISRSYVLGAVRTAADLPAYVRYIRGALRGGVLATRRRGGWGPAILNYIH